MCGISGIFSSTPIEDVSIELMTNALAHRGPDASGIWYNPTRTLALGHRRFSIIDLSENANQPFFSSDGRYVIVFNGEVYNFQQTKNELIEKHGRSFKTHSDTEVIVEAFSVWGIKMAEKLQGMFAIAISDHQEQKLYLFRDRLGKKPLFYYQSDSLFVFASEIKSLLKHRVVRQHVKLNKKVISTFLHLGYIPEPDTIYTSVRKFPAGHVGELDASLKLSITPYWRVEDFVAKKRSGKIEETKREFHSLLDDAVQKRLISDVPLGSFLSGGTDSSLVTALASRHTSKPMKTFNIGFKESKFDESSFARRVAKELKTDHTEYTLDEKEAVNLLETYLIHFDEPFADTSAIPTMLVSKLARQDVKVVLTGDGGDELFQGYGAYAWANRLKKTWWKIARQPLRTGMMLSGNSRLQRIGHMLDTNRIGSIRSHIFSQEQYFFTQSEIQEQLFINPIDFVTFDYDESFLNGKDLSGGEKQAIFDLRYYLKDDLLVKVDRASMFYALECRCPLLDHRVVEYALSLDRSIKVKQTKTKWLLKELLREYLPNHLVDRQKWGFGVPLGNWLKGDLRYLMNDFLSEDVLNEVGICNTAYVRKLKEDFLNGKDYLYNRLWVIIILHKWLKENQQ